MAAVGDVLRALADLAPEPRDADALDVTKTGDPFVWLADGVDPWALFSSEVNVFDPSTRVKVQRGQPTRRLQAIDALHHEEQLLRAGWLWLAGTAVLNGTRRQLCLPLLSRPIRLTESLTSYQVERLGETSITLPTPHRTAAIEWPWFGESGLRYGPAAARGRRASAELVARDRRTRAWIDQVADGAGLPRIEAIVAGAHPTRRDLMQPPGEGLVAVVGSGLYVQRGERLTASATALLEWAEQRGLEHTALAAVYGLGGSTRAPAAGDDVPQPLPLTGAQRTAVERSRHEPVVVVSGAPGNGKSHAVCAIAIDAVARGESVLVATPTAYAADVLGELLRRHPGPEPVFFGETQGRRRMVSALQSLAQRTVDGGELAALRRDVERAVRQHAEAEAVVVGALEREVSAERADRWTLRLPELRAAVPGVFAPGADLREVRRRLERAERGGWWARRRLRKFTGAAPIVGLDVVAEAVAAATDRRAAVEVDIAGGTAIGASWDGLLDAEAKLAHAEGSLVDALARAEDRWRGGGRRAVAALCAALPASRQTRRDHLAAIDATDLVLALPLWIGTVRDVEDLLPARPGLFDVVIIDEAAQVDQVRAAGVLARGRRAVVVGDPRQLRHVSFLGDVEIAAALAAAGVTELADRLDVRRSSLFDVAAGASAVTFLDEHHRCAPHLIEFSARRFYDGRVSVATRHPSNESADRIDVVRAPSVPDEVGVALDVVAGLVTADVRGIGVFTPFRAHADAIENALVERFEPEVLLRHGIRAGTAHAAQGSERAHVVVALGLALDDPPARWRFAEDPNLFNVLVTRAREHLTVVTSLPEQGLRAGVVRDYLRHASRPPAPAEEAPPASPWAVRLAEELRRLGVPVRTGYPVGRWFVDVCAGEDAEAAALDCAVHPDGPAAHIERHRALRRAGWRVVDAFPTRWDGEAARAAVELASGFGPGAPTP